MRYNAPYGVSDPESPYFNGDPSVGRAGSIPPAASIEFPQREIVNIIKDANHVVPTNNDLHQVARSVQSMLLVSDDDAGYSNQYQVTQTPAPTGYYKYMMIITHIKFNNTGPSTLNVNAMGPRPILRVDGSTITAGELLQGSMTCFEYDGNAFHIAWTSGSHVHGMPVFLTAPRTLYVNWDTGSDVGPDGTSPTMIANTLHGPFKTCQRATDEINKWNLNNFNVEVHVAPSVNYPAFRLPVTGGSGSVFWRGYPIDPKQVTITGIHVAAIRAGTNCGSQFIEGFKVQSYGDPWVYEGQDISGVSASGSGNAIWLQHMEYGNTSGPQVLANFSSSIAMGGNHIITGTSSGNAVAPSAFIACAGASSIGTLALGANQPIVTVATPVFYVGSFVYCGHNGIIGWRFQQLNGAGNVTGMRYSVYLNGIIDTNGGGPNYFPGNVAGSAHLQGQYL